MHSLRRAALRSAVSASRSISTTTRMTPFAARISSECNSAKVASPQALRFFSQTIRKASEEKDLEDAERRAEQEDIEGQAAAEAQQDPEEFVSESQADIQEASQESAPQQFNPTGRGQQNQNQQHSAFIRNLVFELTEEHLTKAFAKYGNVSGAFVARDPRGMSKGFGFVSFDTAEELQAACDAVNGSFWHGRRITCIPRTENNNRDTRNKHRNSPNEPTAQLFIGNIPYETTDAELNRIFQGMGNVRDVRVAVDRTTGWPRGFAHADFPTVEAAIEAKNRLEGAKLNDRPLRIDFAQGYRRGQDRAEGRGEGRFDNRRSRDRGDRGDRYDRGDRGDRGDRYDRGDRGGNGGEEFDRY